MYSNLAFAITLLGIFSIFELLKGNQKVSLIKYHFLARLILLTAGSFFDYLELAGYEIPYYKEIFKLITAVLFINMLFLITQRDAILSPTTGLIIFNTTTNGLEVRNSNGWVLLTPAAVALPTVVIGTQQWMEKNLDVLTYRNGDVIPQVTDQTAWAALTTGAWCYFNNDPSGYGVIYGKLYNWYPVNDPRGLAPQGWHIPTDEEWTSLRTKLGGELAGAKMKTTTRWINPTNAYKGAGTTNESGFSGLPGICREESGKFITYIGQVGYWWTASDYSTSNAYYRLLSYDTDNFLKGNENKKRGFSVRCIRD